METKLRVQRYDPGAGRKPYTQDYTIDMPDGATVLDALIEVRERVDESLALRCSCRSSICGSCAMRINGQATLACKTRITSVLNKEGQVVVEPAGNMPVLKDLVVDFEVFWRKNLAITPWIQPEGPEPEREYLVDNNAMINLITTVGCIQCGACVSECASLAANPDFLGPAALAKAYRFVGDPRDGHKQERLEEYSKPGGIWDCTHCYFCVEVCPKEVAPMEWILELRREATEAGLTDNNGSRHSAAFEESVKESGWLDEGKLALDSVGTLQEKLAMVPVGLRAMFRGKMPPTGPLHSPRPGVEHVRRIIEELEAH